MLEVDSDNFGFGGCGYLLQTVKRLGGGVESQLASQDDQLFLSVADILG